MGGSYDQLVQLYSVVEFSIRSSSSSQRLKTVTSGKEAEEKEHKLCSSREESFYEQQGKRRLIGERVNITCEDCVCITVD